jgi:adenylosuccinate synthase
MTWEELRRESNSPVPLDEYTSVTHKLRRVGRFDWDEARRAINLNRPTRLALNFTDHLNFENRLASNYYDLSLNAKSFIADLEDLGGPVCYIGTGPQLTDGIILEPFDRDNFSASSRPSLQPASFGE